MAIEKERRHFQILYKIRKFQKIKREKKLKKSKTVLRFGHKIERALSLWKFAVKRSSGQVAETFVEV
ncbi:MAG: hypothetical protein LBT05_13370 [Planctomycetaceae bacterium]|jgi:hypothetical protein|nr:hypothetical protein [Planctomycetaceae bacterium]